MEDFTGAVERIVAGLEKKSRILIPRERRIVAYHEMGHALVALAIPGSDPIQKVSIIPRGIGALGYTLQRPTDDRFLMGRHELENRMTVLMGGRAAEMLLGEDISTGAADDLAKATDISRGMVLRFGMDEKLGPVAWDTEQGQFLNQPGVFWQPRRFSDETAHEIDVAVRAHLEGALARAVGILTANRAELDEGAARCLRTRRWGRRNCRRSWQRQRPIDATPAHSLRSRSDFRQHRFARGPGLMHDVPKDLVWLSQLIGDGTPPCAGGVSVVLRECRADPCRDDAPLRLAGMRHGIAHKVDTAALPRGVQHAIGGGLETLCQINPPCRSRAWDKRFSDDDLDLIIGLMERRPKTATSC